MIKKILIYLVVGPALLLLTSTVTGASDRRDDVREIDRMRYDVRAEKVYEGSVESKGRVVDGVMYFPLRMSPDITMEVQIGPEDTVKHSGFKLKIGEMVTVVGMPIVWKGRDLILAREVSNMVSLLLVRDRDGFPIWDTNRPIRMDPERSESNWCELLKP